MIRLIPELAEPGNGIGQADESGGAAGRRTMPSQGRENKTIIREKRGEKPQKIVQWREVSDTPRQFYGELVQVARGV